MLRKPNHTQVPNEFIDDCMRGLSGSACKVFLVICRKTIGWHKETDQISQGQIAELTGIRIQAVRKALDELLAAGLITKETSGEGRATKTVYGVNFEAKENGVKITTLPDSNGVKITPIATNIGVKITPTKETEDKEKELKKGALPYGEIVAHLNAETGRKFNPLNAQTQRLIHARWVEGYRLDQFKRVISYKVHDWKGTEWEKYLRPQTLFSPKFEGYLMGSETWAEEQRHEQRKQDAEDAAERQRAIEQRILFGANA